MENLMFSLNATVPIFLLMLLGLLFRKLGWIDEEFAAKLNKFVFLVPLPVLLFGDLATVDFSEVWNPKFVLFCFAATLGLRLCVPWCGRIGVSRENSFRLLIEAVQRFWELLSFRIFTETPGWRR